LRASLAAAAPLITGPRYNIAPGTEVAAITTDREGSPRGELLRWGLVPAWAREPKLGVKMINARAETLGERPAYRGALKRLRCLIPADGFYEWQARPGARKQPFHITRANGEAFAFAGLWSIWHGGQDDELRTLTIITTAANDRMARVHARMPVILEPAAEALWLDPATDPGALQGLLHGLDAEDTRLRAVGTAVNNARYDGPDCLADPATLFPSGR
ncbi:MAG: SOS response-associated peptidase, partial [Solirubrobacteraceae bacterium]